METLNTNNNDINKEDGELSSDDGNDNQEESVTIIPQSAQSRMIHQTTRRGRNAGTWNDSDSKGNVNQFGVQNTRSFRSVRGHGFKGYRRFYDYRQSSIFRRSKSPKFLGNQRLRSPSSRPLRSPRRTILSGAKKSNHTSQHELQRRKIMTNDQDELEELMKQRTKIREQLKDLENEDISGFDSLLDAVEALEDLDGVEAHEVQDVDPGTDKQPVPLILDVHNSTVLDYTLETKNEGAELYKEESPEEDVGALSSEPLKSQSVQEWHQRLEAVKLLATDKPVLALEQLVTFSNEWDGVGRDIVVELIKDIKNSTCQDVPENREDKILTSAYAPSLYAHNTSRHDMQQICSPSTPEYQFYPPQHFTETPIRQHRHAHPSATSNEQEPLWNRQQLSRGNTNVEMPNNRSRQRSFSDGPRANSVYDRKLPLQDIAVPTLGNKFPESADRIFLVANSRDSKEVDKSFAHTINRQLHNIRHNTDEHRHAQNAKQHGSSSASLWKSAIKDPDITKYKNNGRNIVKYSSSFDDFLTTQENYNNQHVDASKTGHHSSDESGGFDLHMQAHSPFKTGQRTLNYTSGIGSTHYLSNEKDKSPKSLKNNRTSPNLTITVATERELVPPRKHYSLDHITIKVDDSVDESGNNRRVILTDPSKSRRKSCSSHEQRTPRNDIRYPSNSFNIKQNEDFKSRFRPSYEASLQTPPTKKVKNDQPSPNILTSKTHFEALIDASVPEKNHTNDSSDSEDEIEQRRKLLKSMQRKRETLNEAHQCEITPPDVLPILDAANSEPSGTAISIGTEEELSADHQEKVYSPNSVLNVSQENSEKDVQSYPGLGLSNLKEPQSLAELCQTKLSPTEIHHKLESHNQDEQPSQIDHQFHTDCTNIYKLDIDGIDDAFIVGTQNHVPEETSQLTIVEDRSTEETSQLTIVEDRSTEETSQLTIVEDRSTEETSQLTIVDDRPTEETSQLTIVEDRSTEETSQLTIVEDRSTEETSQLTIVEDRSTEETSQLTIVEDRSTEETSQLTIVEDRSTEETSQLTIVEDRSTEETSQLTIVEDRSTEETSQLTIVEDRSTNEENHCAAAESADLSKFDFESAITFVVKTEIHIPGEILELPDIEDINRDRIIMRRNHSFELEGTDLPKLDPDISGAFVMNSQTHVPEEISHGCEVEHRITKQENDCVRTITNDLSKPNPDINVTLVISDKTHVPEETSQLLVSEDIVTAQENDSVTANGKDLSNSNLDITDTFVMVRNTNVLREISQESEVEGRNIILKEENHLTAAEYTDLDKFDHGSSGTVAMPNPSHVSEEVYIEDNKMGENLCNTDLDKFDHGSSGTVAMPNPSHVSEEVYIEDNKMGENLCNKNIQKLDHYSSGAVGMPDPSHLEERPHLLLDREVIIMEERPCTGVDGTDQPTLGPDNTGAFTVTTQECVQEEFSHLPDVEQSNTKEEIYQSTAKSTDLKKLDLKIEDFFMKSQVLITEENSQPFDVECKNRNRVTKEENHCVKTSPKSLHAESNLGLSASPICPQNNLHFENSLPSNTKSLHESSIETSTERINKVTLGRHQTIKYSREAEFNSSLPAISSSSLNTYGISSQSQFVPENIKVAEYASSNRHLKRKSVSFLDYPSPKKTAMISESSKSVHQRLGPPVAAVPLTISDMIQDSQHKPRRRSRFSVNNTANEVLANESSTFKTAATATQLSPEFQATVSSDISCFSNQPQLPVIITRVYRKQLKFPVHPRVVIPIKPSSDSEDDTYSLACSVGQKGEKRDRDMPERVLVEVSNKKRASPQYRRKQDENLNYLELTIQADQTTVDSLKNKAEQYHGLKIQVEKNLDKLRRQVTLMNRQIIANEELVTTCKTLEDKVQNEIQVLLDKQKSLDTEKIKCAVSSRLTEDMILPDSNPSQESATKAKQGLTKAQQMALKKNILLKQINGFDEEIRKRKEYIAKKKNEQASTFKKDVVEKIQISGPEVNLQDMINTDENGNTRVTEVEKRNSTPEMDTTIQTEVEKQNYMLEMDTTIQTQVQKQNYMLEMDTTIQTKVEKQNSMVEMDTTIQTEVEKQNYMLEMDTTIQTEVEKQNSMVEMDTTIQTEVKKQNSMVEMDTTIQTEVEKQNSMGEKQNSMAEMNTTIQTEVGKQNCMETDTTMQTDFSVNQCRSSVPTNLDKENMDLSGTSILNADQQKFDGNMNDDCNLTLQLPEESLAPSLDERIKDHV